MNSVKQKPFDIRSKEFNKELKNLCEKYQVELKPMLTFPQYNKLPAELELCNIILVKNDGQFTITFTDLAKKE